MTRCQAHQNACGMWQDAIASSFLRPSSKGVPKCWNVSAQVVSLVQLSRQVCIRLRKDCHSLWAQPAVDGKLAFMPREHLAIMDVDNIQWTHQTLFDHFSDGATINGPFSWSTCSLARRVLGTDVVEIDAFVLYPQPTLDGPEVFQQNLRDNGSNKSVVDRVEDLVFGKTDLGSSC